MNEVLNSVTGPLLTDFNALSTIHAYWSQQQDQTAVFDLCVRTLPPSRNFLVAAGLEQAVGFLEEVRVLPSELEWIARCGRFRPGFADYVGGLRFSGDLDALPEGTVFFPDEPILRVTAPLSVAQFLETRLVNLVHFQTMVATKATRCVMAAKGKKLIDFRLRPAHGAEAGLLAARASFLAGFSSTATASGAALGIPVCGTMNRSFLEAYGEEADAFVAYVRANPDGAIVLIDDAESDAEKLVHVERFLRKEGARIGGVSLDGANVAVQARRVRAVLDRAGLRGVAIYADSSFLDEFSLERLAAQEVPVDGFAVGAQMVSGDAPATDCVYTLQEYAGRPPRRRAGAVAAYPGRRQVFRRYDPFGCLHEDVLSVDGDRLEGEELLVPVMRGGRRVADLPSLLSLRERARGQRERLPGSLRSLTKVSPYRVSVSPRLVERTRCSDPAEAGGPAAPSAAPRRGDAHLSR